MLEEELKARTLIKPMSMAEFDAHYKQVVEFVRKKMRAGIDYGVIPGTQKRILYKAGAEKLGFLLGLKPKFELLKEIEDIENGIYFYKYRCLLIHFTTGKFASEAVRSCSSLEKKYAFQTVAEKYATDEQKKNAVERYQNTNGFWTLKIKKTPQEIADLANTIEAIAQKRALVAATVHATMATEIFNDIEDTLQEGGQNDS